MAETNMDDLTDDNNEEENKELLEIYKIFDDIYSKAPEVLKDLSSISIDVDYKEYIKDFIDFEKIKQKIENKEYTSMTDIMKDIRIVFLNCYTFYGAKSDNTIKSLKLEELLENKISLLDETFKSLASIEHTLRLLNIEKKENSKFRYPKNCYDSILLRSVGHCRFERLKQYHTIICNILTTDEDNIHLLEELSSWKNEIYFNDNYRHISSMWELADIGNFLSIIFKEFGFDIINQCEIERMFLMPKESSTMSKIMTTLLMPTKKNKYIGQFMPYDVWSKRLFTKVSDWYKVYNLKNKNKTRAFQSLGIHPDFWTVVGNKNPLVLCDYCELSYFIKVWLVKGLCDNVTEKYKSIRNILTNCNERHCTIWKNDMETEEYFFFNSMPDLRIYYFNIPYDEPNLEFLDSENSNNETIGNDNLLISDISSDFHTNSRVKPNEKYFKLIANSVQGLRSFLNELCSEDMSVPEDLIQALEDFLIKIEPEECNLIILENNSKIKLFKDWKSYPERFQKEKDKISFWEEKELKSLSQDNYEEIIPEKRKRKAIAIQEFQYDSDKSYYESDDKSLTDFTDSDDEWGAMNCPKNKVKQLVQTTSKLVELEKQLEKEDKLVKRQKKCSLDNHIENNFCKVQIKNQLIGIEQSKNKINKNFLGTKNTFNNGCDKRLNNQKSTDIIKIKTEVSDDSEKEEVVSVDSEKEEVVSVDSEKEVILVDSKNEEIVSVDSEEEVVSVDSEEDVVNSVDILMKKKIISRNNKNENLPNCKNLKLDIQGVQNKTIDDHKLDCQILSQNNSKAIISENCVDTFSASNKQSNDTINSSKLNLNKNDEVISIEDDSEQIIISDDEDDVQIVSVIPSKSQSLPVKINRSFSLNNNWNKSRNSISRNNQMTAVNRINRQSASINIPKLSRNISIMPANVHVPKGIEVTVVKQPQNVISSHFNVTKRSTNRSNSNLTNGCNGNLTNRTNGSLTNDCSIVNVECEVISKPNSNGEVKFYINLPNGALHPVSNELMNQYLKEHNNRLPDYWMVPLPVEVAKQYGFNYNVK